VQFAWGVPTLKDRVVQMAVVLRGEPIFEADFQNCSMDSVREDRRTRHWNSSGKVWRQD